MTTRRTHNLTTLRAAVLALSMVCAFAASLAVEVLHLAWTPHTVCAQHGELIHAEHHAFSLDDSPSHGLSALPADESHHDHDHCKTALFDHSEPASNPPPQVTDVEIPADLLSAPARADRAHRTIDLTLLAPKTSPPTA